ncbi:bifunctional metallophosphatase/5'-nucleotidase [Halegenticoccus tardaugens]|uniref:bifunctional metallophosphatase/5'-nucleotidase n=1 Tax=Halegenticoccus tardaugens TaxID=2071624 RepID=UPI00100BEB22|nr:5'-nucleotidase C-terminal domain-containing protein [Halegenticoccus tardaugens]
MAVRLLHYSDLENAYDDPARIGRLAGLVADRRDDRTLVVGTGDDTAPGVLALETEGAQALDFFRAVRPDAETFGNHDFDFGPDRTREIVRDSPQPWLSANVRESDGSPFAGVDPGVVVERGGTRVGLLGLTDPNTPGMCPAASALTFVDPVAAARETVADLRARGADRIVVLSHLGSLDDELTRRLDVDAILGGHVHEERCDRVAGTLCTRPNANGRVVWEVELGSGGATATRRRVADAPCDEAVAARLCDRLARAGLTTVVGSVANPIRRGRSIRYGGECRLANLVTDAYRWATGADVAFTNTGGLRDGPSLSGEVTKGQLVGVSPFRGALRTVEVTGRELRALAAQAAKPTGLRSRRSWSEKRWWGHVSGMRIVWDRAADELVEATVGGDPVARDETYTVATNGFVVGSTPFSALTADHVVADHGVQYDAVVEYAREAGIDPTLDGRLVDLGARSD